MLKIIIFPLNIQLTFLTFQCHLLKDILYHMETTRLQPIRIIVKAVGQPVKRCVTMIIYAMDIPLICITISAISVVALTIPVSQHVLSVFMQ